MLSPVILPRQSWGPAAAPLRALLVHGLGSNGALMWRYAVGLTTEADPDVRRGQRWRADAVDLRGHGVAPRALDYTIEAYAADLKQTLPADGGTWDLVIAHSLGGAAATVAAADVPSWTRHLVLIDPAIHLAPRDRGIVRRSQEAAFADPTAQFVRGEHPHWHENDIELKAQAAQQASRWAVDQTSVQNAEWDVREAASRLRVPTHVLASDPKVYTIFDADLSAQVRANPVVAETRIAGAGHSPHRDRPERTIAALWSAVADWFPEA